MKTKKKKLRKVRKNRFYWSLGFMNLNPTQTKRPNFDKESSRDYKLTFDVITE